MDKLDGKIVIVTGAARGLGHAYAKRLAGTDSKFRGRRPEPALV